MAILPQPVGWAVVLGFGAFFSIVMTLLTKAQERYLGEVQTSEQFMTAGRTIKTGLTASAVVSSWTWAATLLQSSSVAYNYGVSGPFWYASGATIQVLLFAILAIEVKRKAPNAHTFLEIVLARYGKATHLVFLAFGLATNMIVTAMLVLGGAAVVSELTDMPVYAACMLIPLGVTAYVVTGGLKATFLTDYAHTCFIYIIILLFGFTVYASSNLVGSPGKMYDLLAEAAVRHPIPNNEGGQYLTMSSTDGLIFGIINVVGNFGTVFVDQAYWQRAIAARPTSTVKGYILGGLCWFAIPFFLATTLGLAAVGLENNPAFPTYPLRMEPAAVSAGLVAPQAAVTLLGSGGALAILILVFVAVTSSTSAELIAVSTVLTYDVYRTYFKPDATGKEIIRFSHMMIMTFGVVMGVLGIILNFIGISLGYLYLMMGIIVSPAVFPICFTLTWKKQSKLGAIGACLFGLTCGVIAWLSVAAAEKGVINLASTGSNYPMLSGNLVSLGASCIFTIVASLLKPDDFDFNITRDSLTQLVDEGDKKMDHDAPVVVEDPVALNKAAKLAYVVSLLLTLFLIILWPLPMYFSKYVFSKAFFYGWIVLGLVWSITAASLVIFLPIIESFDGLKMFFKGVKGDLTGTRVPVKQFDGKMTEVAVA